MRTKYIKAVRNEIGHYGFTLNEIDGMLPKFMEIFGDDSFDEIAANVSLFLDRYRYARWREQYKYAESWASLF